MKVHLQPQPGLSRAMNRVAKALTQSAPVEITDSKRDADLVILHVIGYPETEKAIELAIRRKQKYAIIQYCMRTTQKPSTLDWAPLWMGAEVVWSYYDLHQLMIEDGVVQDFHFYYAPLGVDSAFVLPSNQSKRPYTIMTSGYVAESEGAREAHVAVAQVKGRQLHLGPSTLELGACVDYHLDIDDDKLAALYAQCQFVAGLRRSEGFELPAAEGLLCGARPVVFDRPHYRSWYEGLADFVPEDDYLDIHLTKLFESGARLVSSSEHAEAKERFNWSRITEGFWKEVTA